MILAVLTLAKEESFWEVFVDGASNAKGVGVGMVMFIIDGGIIEQSIKVTFPATNIIVEYKAMLLALKELKGLRVECVNIPSDSDWLYAK